jgi:plastocyanin
LALPAFPAGAADSEVAVGNFFYRAAYVRVEPGDTVTWRLKDGSNHTMTTRPEAPVGFDSGELAPGQTFAVTFTEPGRYPYRCRIHRNLGQDGVVQVGPDTTRPVVRRLRAKRGRKSVRLSFRLSEDARVKVTLRRKGETVRTVGTKLLTQGSRSVLLRRSKLASGPYVAKLTAADRAENASKAKRVRFSVPEKR